MASYQSQMDGNIPISNNVLIKMGVDELRVLITEVVQKAVQGLQKTEAVIDAAVENQDGDEIGLADFDIAEGIMKVETEADEGT